MQHFNSHCSNHIKLINKVLFCHLQQSSNLRYYSKWSNTSFARQRFIVTAAKIFSNQKNNLHQILVYQHECDIVKILTFFFIYYPLNFFQPKQTKIKEAARDKMLQKLKNSLSQSRAVDTQDKNTSSEDEVPQCLHNVCILSYWVFGYIFIVWMFYKQDRTKKNSIRINKAFI